MSKEKNKKKIDSIKILALVNGVVGKTSFIMKFTENYFHENYLMTVGFEFQTKKVKFKDQTYTVYFYDTAGQERYKSLSVSLYKKADGIILMYDVTKRKTYEDIPEWMNNIKENKGLEYPIILIGNKCDLEEKREILKEEGENLAKNYNLSFYETSNKEGKNVEEVGMELIKKIIDRKEKQKEETENNNNVIELKKENHKKNNILKKLFPCCFN